MQQLLLSPNPHLSPSTFLCYKERTAHHTMRIIPLRHWKPCHVFFANVFLNCCSITSCSVPGWWPNAAAAQASTFPVWWLHICLNVLLSHLSVLQHSFCCFYESLSTLPTLQFYFLITTVHQAGFHLERAALCQAYHLIHQRAVRQLSMLHTPCSCPPRATPLLVTLVCCAVETSNIAARLPVCCQNNPI